MLTLAMILGGASGVLLRLFVERAYSDRHVVSFSNSLALTAAGAFLLGVVSGLALPARHPGELGGVFGVAAGAALLTYCVFGAPAVHLVGRQGVLRPVASTVVHTLGGFAAAVPGVLLALWALGG